MKTCLKKCLNVTEKHCFEKQTKVVLEQVVTKDFSVVLNCLPSWYSDTGMQREVVIYGLCNFKCKLHV